MKFFGAALLAALFSGNLASAGSFADGCKKIGNELLCKGHKECSITNVRGGAKKGNNSEKGGYLECKELIEAAQADGISSEAKKAIKRIKDSIEKFNSEIQKDIPFVKLSADFSRLELEDIVQNAMWKGNYDKDAKVAESWAFQLFRSDDAKVFEENYLKHIRSALNSIADTDDGKASLKNKISEVRLTFASHNATAWNPNMKIENKVLLLPGNFKHDNSVYTYDMIEKALK